MEYFKNRVNEVVLKDAVKKSARRFNVLDVLFDSFKDGVIDKEYFSNKINETNQQNFVYGYINGVEDAVNGDYGKSYLCPSSDDNCDAVKNIDFAFVFTFTDNDFGGFFEECAKLYEKKINDCFDRFNTYTPLENGGLMVESCFDEIKELQKKTFLQVFFKTTFLGAYLKHKFDYISSFSEINYEKSLERAKDIAENYMPFNDDKFWFIGTCDEVDKYLKENYENTFNGHTSIWNNGETLVVKIQNGVIDFQII